MLKMKEVYFINRSRTRLKIEIHMATTKRTKLISDQLKGN